MVRPTGAQRYTAIACFRDHCKCNDRDDLSRFTDRDRCK